MRIITWNCNGKFSEKFPAILEEDADIYVIQECENPSIIDSNEYKDFASNYFWVGENQYYGLGIFARDDVKLELADLDDNGLRYFIPVRVNDEFNLLGVWTNPDMDGNKSIHYPKEITKYYDEHKDSGFFNEDMIICGDFNCDVRLKGAHAKNVYEVIEKLSECGLTDTYHYLNNEKQGEESQPTFFMYRHLDKPFHLDHVFAKKGRIGDLQIGDEEKWIKLSDHIPIVFDTSYNTVKNEDFVIPTPTVEEVEKYIGEWYSLENYVNQENSLDKLFFDLIPENKLIEDILIKSSTLNDFYSTQIFSIFTVGKHIYQLDIDKRLDEGDLTLVNDIADVKELNRRFYSFATKYCSHHNPDRFPIYDSYVDKILRYFRKKDKFAKFSNNDLKDYVKFNDILHQFAHYYSLEQYSLKELDRYLWLLGKRYFKNK